MKLSKAMLEELRKQACLSALDATVGAGTPRNRAPCGAYCFSRIERGDATYYNELYTHDGTLKALERRGLVERRGAFPTCARLTDPGRKLVSSCGRDDCPLEVDDAG